MIRSVAAIAAVAFVTVALASPVLAQAPSVSKRVVVEDNETIVMLSVSASDRSVYGIYVEDASASIRDIKVPKGWVGISSGDVILFRTLEEPITFGETLTFRIMTNNPGANLSVTFRDNKAFFGLKQSL